MTCDVGNPGPGLGQTHQWNEKQEHSIYD